jgi:hypothetical protein
MYTLPKVENFTNMKFYRYLFWQVNFYLFWLLKAKSEPTLIQN